MNGGAPHSLLDTGDPIVYTLRAMTLVRNNPANQRTA